MPEKRSYLLGLIGHPVSHSLSPALHESALAYHGLDGKYNLIDVEPSELESRFKSLIEEGYDGVNVTIPHKQAVIPLLDRLTPCASQVGAVNTISFVDGKTVGDNTDVYGFVSAIQEFFDRSSSKGLRFNMPPDYERHAVVVGTGGAARAAIFGLQELGFTNVYVKGRDWQKSQKFVESFDLDGIKPVQLIPEHHWIPNPGPILSLFINATSIGQKEDVVPDWLLMLLGQASKKCAVFDLVYSRSHEPTAVMRAAAAQRLHRFDGTSMLVHQADRAFSIWTGKSGSDQCMCEAIHRSLS